jgi:hypothetical protein
MSSLNNALEYYLSLGFCVIPALPFSKQPSVEWKRYQSVKPDESEIEEWKRQFWSKGYNIGCLGGKVSGNLAVIDIDDETLLKKINVEKLVRNTMCVKTGSGKLHIYLRTLEPMRTVKFLGEDKRVRVEVRGEGSFTLLPPSIHPETKAEYVLLSAPDDLLIMNDVVESLTKQLGVKPTLEPVSEPISFKDLRYTPPCLKRLLTEAEIPRGFRNESLIRVVSYLRQKVKSESELYSKAAAWNLKHCNPPLELNEVYQVVKSVLKHGYTYGCRGLKPVCSEEYKAKCKLYQKLVKGLHETLAEIRNVEFVD